MNDEIDLGKVTLDLWEGKWKIVMSAIIAFIIGLGFIFFQPQPNYESITLIKPINSIEARKYETLNSNNLLNVTPQILIDLYVEQIEYKTLFINAITDLDIYKKSDYKTEDDYNNAILRLATKITIEQDKDNNYQILFSHTDQELWKNIFSEFHKLNEEFIRNEFIKRFNHEVLSFKQKKIIELEDIQILKNNAIEDFDKNISKLNLQKNFEIEDIKVLKDNALLDYDAKIKNRIAFLNEQKQIARKLEVAKNSITLVETQIFTTQKVGNLSSDTPFYLRGYEAIEKEIELLKNREDKTAFIDDLFELEKKERALRQDKTAQRSKLNKSFLSSILQLEKKERKLKQNKTLERAEIYFKSSPLNDKENFLTINLNIVNTVFKYKNNQKIIILIFAVFLGLFVGGIYVLISNNLKNRKKLPAS